MCFTYLSFLKHWNLKINKRIFSIIAKLEGVLDKWKRVVKSSMIYNGAPLLFAVKEYICTFYPTASAADASCNANFRAMGCFKYNKEVEQQFSRVLFSDPFKKISTYGFSDFMFDLVCRCALATRTNKLHNFAISSKGIIFVSHKS